MPFTEWPYGGSTNLGVTRPNAVDSPLMVALGNTELGKAMSDAHIQAYGWVNGGGNISTNKVTPGGNFPASYDYTPNTVQLDQAVVYVERLPDTVQTDHIDWGFRFSGIYGENYRYTTAFGVASYQLLGHNLTNGFDMPMMYGEVFLPQVADGLLLRLGRYISLPDIEAQLAPNNYMYTHSFAYTFDNYTSHGIQSTLALSKNWFFQLGVSLGTDTAPWHWGQKVANPFPNPVFPDTTMLRDPGAKPSVTAGVRWQSDNGWDNIYVVANAINDGTWGYNNLNWYGITWYHNFNSQWHFSSETYVLSQKKVLNAADPGGHHRQQRLSLRDPEWIQVQRAGIRAMQQPLCPHLHGGGVHVAVVCELQESPRSTTCRSAASSITTWRASAPAPKPATWNSASAGSTGTRRRSNSGRRSPITVRSMPTLSTAIPTHPSPPSTKNYSWVGAMDLIWHF